MNLIYKKYIFFEEFTFFKSNQTILNKKQKNMNQIKQSE